jgi:hypothetical protein
MTKRILGIQAHHAVKDGRKQHRHHHPSKSPTDTSLALLLKPMHNYQPFDVVRHHNHMGIAYAQLNIAHTPDVFGFWGTSPYSDGMDG